MVRISSRDSDHSELLQTVTTDKRTIELFTPTDAHWVIPLIMYDCSAVCASVPGENEKRADPASTRFHIEEPMPWVYVYDTLGVMYQYHTVFLSSAGLWAVAEVTNMNRFTGLYVNKLPPNGKKQSLKWIWVLISRASQQRTWPVPRLFCNTMASNSCLVGVMECIKLKHLRIYLTSSTMNKKAQYITSGSWQNLTKDKTTKYDNNIIRAVTG